MSRFILGRSHYWTWVAVLMALKLALVVVIEVEPRLLSLTGSLTGYLETVLMVLLALVVGARFVDIGWSRWLGVALVALAVLLAPLALVFVAPPSQPDSGMSLLEILAESSIWLSSVALTILLVVAGCMRSAQPSVAPG